MRCRTVTIPRSWYRRSLPCAVFALFAWAILQEAPAGASSSQSLRKEWQVTLGPTRARVHLYRAGICSTGSAFFTDGHGRLGAVDRDGAIVKDVFLPELVGAKAVACDEIGRALVGVSTSQGSHLVALEDNGRTFQVRWKSPDIRAPIFLVEPSPAATFILAPVRLATGELRFLHRIGADGALTHSFGTVPFHLDSARLLQAITEGSLTWSWATNQLVFVSSGSADFQFYSPSGKLEAVHPRPDPDFLPMAPSAWSSPVFRRDSLLRIVGLPGGDIVAFVNKQREASSRSFLEILRPTHRELLVIRTHIPISGDGGYGFLLGADRDGALYFARGLANSEASLIKARLAPDAP